MKLTPEQRIRLKTYCMFRRKPPTRFDQLKLIAPQMAMFALLCTIAAVCTFVDNPFSSGVALVMLGFFVGSAAASVTLVMMNFHMWPLLEHITDWKRVEELKRENALDAE